MCGKSHFVQEMLINRRKIFDVDFDRVVWCYSISSSVPDIQGIDEFHQGIPSSFQNDANEKVFYIIDDLMDDLNSEKISNLFTKYSHHLGISVCVITQNLYQKGSHFRTVSLNAKYIVIFKQPRDKSQFSFLA